MEKRSRIRKRAKGYMGGFGEREGKREIIKLYYNLKNKRNKF